MQLGCQPGIRTGLAYVTHNERGSAMALPDPTDYGYTSTTFFVTPLGSPEDDTYKVQMFRDGRSAGFFTTSALHLFKHLARWSDDGFTVETIGRTTVLRQTTGRH